MSVTLCSPYEYPTEIDKYFKIVMLGESGVGKSSLWGSFHEDSPVSDYYSYRCEFLTRFMNYDGQIIKVQVWDTCGQERFRAITKSYYRGALGILLVFDITDTKSFEKLTFWLNEIKKEAAPDISIVVVGNKIDLERQRTVDYSTAKRFCEGISIPYVETSAKEYRGVKDAFLLLVSNILANCKSQDAANNVDINIIAEQQQTCGC